MMSVLRNRTVWLFGLAALLGTSGCIIGDDSDDPAFTVGWSLVYIGSNQAVACDVAGTPTVKLLMENVATNQLYTDDFPCSAQGGDSRKLPPGTYHVKIALLNPQGKEVSNADGRFVLGRHGLTDLGVIGFEIQSFQISWSLARGRMSLACKDVDAKSVNLVTRLASDDPVVYSFPCTAGSGASPAILLGSYSVRVDLVATSGDVLWTSDVMTRPVDDTRREVLPPITFDLP
jgi:hypothetical protein